MKTIQSQRYYLVMVSNALTERRKDKKPDYHWVTGSISNAELLDHAYPYADHEGYVISRKNITEEEYRFATR